MTRHTLKNQPPSKPAGNVSPSQFKLRENEASHEANDLVHLIRKGVRCGTDKRGFVMPRGRSRTRIVLDSSEGFVPLWARDTTLRWRFQESSLTAFEDPEAAKAGIEEMLAEAILQWEDAAPVKFAKRDDAWDFEIVMKKNNDCDNNGCVLAEAFFPDAGRHKLFLYPKMFDDKKKEQIETLVHEIGHVFGLRHFFAQISETEWASEIFGRHDKFSIMNYGANSKLTKHDRADLKKLYQMVWTGELADINGTRIKLMKPFHAVGEPAVALRHYPAIAQPARRQGRG